MSTFWIITWITLAAICFLTAFVAVFFNLDYKKIPIAYVLLADILGAIPGLNLLFALVLIVAIIAGIGDQAITPKEHPFGNDEDEDE